MTSPQPHPPLAVDGQGKLGPYLRTVRKGQQLRIDDAAGLFGVSVDLLSRLENGVGSVRLDKLLAVLDGLGLGLMVAPKDVVQDLLSGRETLHDEHD